MLTTSARLTGNHRILMRIALGTMLILLTVVTGLKLYQRQQWLVPPPHAVNSAQKMAQYSEAICAALGYPVHLLATPQFHLNYGISPEGKARFHPIWMALGESGGKQINMIIDDRTRAVLCMIMESRSQVSEAETSSVAPLTQPEAVGSVALHHLRSLAVLSGDTRVRFVNRPKLARAHSAWTVDWKILPAGNGPMTTANMVLDRRTGALLSFSHSLN